MAHSSWQSATRIWAMFMLLVLTTAACGASNGADASASDGDGEANNDAVAGVSDSTIRIAVLTADLQPLRDLGFDVPDGLNNAFNRALLESYFEDWNAEGGIHGRTVEYVEVNWNPLDPSTMERACNETALDSDVFMVLSAAGFAGTFIPCFTVDNDLLFFGADGISQATIDRAPTRTFSLSPTPEELARATISGAVAIGYLHAGSVVGLLTASDSPAPAEATELMLELLEGDGYETVVVDITTVNADADAVTAEAAAAVSTFAANDVTNVFNLLSLIQTGGFFSEQAVMGLPWDVVQLDVSSSNCSVFGASRLLPTAVGAFCVTGEEGYSATDGTIVPDTAVEAECREHFFEALGHEVGERSDPGVPNGDTIEPVDGPTLYSDYSAPACNLARIVREGLQRAGRELTMDTMAQALLTIDDVPLAAYSNGQGAFAPGDNSYAELVRAVQLVGVDPLAQLDANKSFSGCPVPRNCWVPIDDVWIEVN